MSFIRIGGLDERLVNACIGELVGVQQALAGWPGMTPHVQTFRRCRSCFTGCVVKILRVLNGSRSGSMLAMLVAAAGC